MLTNIITYGASLLNAIVGTVLTLRGDYGEAQCLLLSAIFLYLLSQGEGWKHIGDR